MLRLPREADQRRAQLPKSQRLVSIQRMRRAAHRQQSLPLKTPECYGDTYTDSVRNVIARTNCDRGTAHTDVDTRTEPDRQGDEYGDARTNRNSAAN